MADFPPGPKDPLLGIRLLRRFRSDPLNFVEQIARQYGDLAYLRFGPVRTYFVFHPQLVREVLVTRHKHFVRPEVLIGPLRQIDGNGLVLSEGEVWKRQRRLLQPAFSARRFDAYGRVTVDYTKRMLAGWNGGHSLDIADAMTQLTLEINAKLLFGAELAGRTRELGEAVHAVAEMVFAETGYPVHLPDWLPIASKRRKRWAIRTLHELVSEIIRERRASGEDRGDLLSMLLLAVDEEADGNGMTDQQARDEAITLFNAGHDSTAAALAWIWYLVARHPAVETRLVEEIDGVLSGNDPSYADMARLPYTEMVIKEAMRLYPPTWTLLPREVIEPLELGGYPIPRGAWLYMFPWATQRDPRWFPSPETFAPERFRPDRESELPPYAYFPFGGGPRVCIGGALAMMQLVLILATVLKSFRLKLAPGQGQVEPEPLISIRPRGGLQVSVTRRSESALAGGLSWQ
jgi:cytochrome P450